MIWNVLLTFGTMSTTILLLGIAFDRDQPKANWLLAAAASSAMAFVGSLGMLVTNA